MISDINDHDLVAGIVATTVFAGWASPEGIIKATLPRVRSLGIRRGLPPKKQLLFVLVILTSTGRIAMNVASQTNGLVQTFDARFSVPSRTFRISNPRGTRIKLRSRDKLFRLRDTASYRSDLISLFSLRLCVFA